MIRKEYTHKKWIKGKVLHRTKTTAEEVAKYCKVAGLDFRIRATQKGYKLDTRH